MDEQKEFITNSTPSEPVTEAVPEIDIPTLRTYKGDISNTVNRDKITTAKILIAEQKRETSAQDTALETSIKRPTNILVLVLGVILLVGAVGVIGYFGYSKIAQQVFEPITVPTSFLFVFDEEKFIDTKKEKTEIYSDVEKNIQEVSQMKDETYTDIVFFKTNSETEEDVRISAYEFFGLYDIKLPTNFARSISQDFVYGIYKTNGKLEPFLVVGLVDYENAYSSMFLWESTLALDIKDIFPVLKNLFDITKRENTVFLQTSTSTPTSTVSTNSSTSTSMASSSVQATTTILTAEEEFKNQIETRELINRTIRFTDVVFANRDTRAVRDPKGNPFFYYGFINRDKVIFAQDPKLIGEISRKIKEKSLVR